MAWCYPIVSASKVINGQVFPQKWDEIVMRHRETGIRVVKRDIISGSSHVRSRVSGIVKPPSSFTASGTTLISIEKVYRLLLTG